ncbi:guanylate kinase [Methylocella sp. CPCC 101449]|jgi:guanylate kinase|uniref:guanylate kinase n=1 Tax=Methylocella sp. CPCC 101449 TaxID=2987531 RepID=UPI00288CED8C|nr:guanylate kinase [Methylocella sp. CPCC 101449]MDT2021523.1 guanylate kinase [Methylocella sp. CPCC 101449]HEV2571615.1 guanylate kinase [Beijerinckiaceae bacterium]
MRAQAKDKSASTGATKQRGLMLILSSPSGAGKTTLTRLLLQDAALDLKLSISVTTRTRRTSELEGVHYYFVSKAEFEKMLADKELLEWAQVHGNFYGTPRGPVEERLASGGDMLFDIDWQGTKQVQKSAPRDVVTIFILPPSMKELRARLERRAEDPADVIANRLDNARHEIERWPMYDYVIVNRDIQEALADVKAILQAERLRRARQHENIEGFVGKLLSEG